jgi:iron complex outermembrane receptor protein
VTISSAFAKQEKHMTRMGWGRQARGRYAFGATLLATSMLAGVPAALAAPAAPAAAPAGATVEELIVTAQKREENIQDVPVAVTAFSTKKLEELHVQNIDDYVKFLPSVSMQSLEPGTFNVYMRGVASGNDGNHSGSLPSVGIYLDEAPITTINGAPDIHVYDIARVEALAGPQGTLYGASSQAGTLRIITNQPELGVLKGRYDLEANTVDHGAAGGVAEGLVNIPLGDKAAIRLVGWDEHDGGFVDNVRATRTYRSSQITINNNAFAKSDFNDTDVLGGRAALRVDLDDNWTIKPSIIAQDTKAHGIYAYDPRLGDLKVEHFGKDDLHDRWYQAALSITGKIQNFDIVYTAAYMDRRESTHSDYTDYSFFYDQQFGSGSYFTDNSGANLVDPSQFIIGHDHFTKQSHEFRVSSPQDKAVRVVGGVFYQDQTHDILQDYKVPAMGTNFQVTGHDHTLWLTDQFREDIDKALFGEVAWDINKKLTLTVGARAFRSENSLKGFFGFGLNNPYGSSTGENKCFAPADVAGAPCTNLDKSVSESGATYKANLTYHVDDDKMIYGTYSEGFRPGGINRRGDLPPYQSDFIKNYEFGWKTLWADHTLKFNGDVYYENWDQFQFSFLGPNSFTEIHNAGAARIIGAETEITWQPTTGLTIGGAAAYTDGQLTQTYCRKLDPVTHEAITNCTGSDVGALKGTQLPVTPKLKANSTVRYQWPWGDYTAHVQGSAVYQGSSWADLRTLERTDLGQQKGYASADLSAGVNRDTWRLEFSIRNLFDTRGQNYRYAECTATVCGGITYIRPNQPRTFAISFGQSF